MEYMAKRCGCTERLGYSEEFTHRDHVPRTWYSLLFEYPAPLWSPRCIWNLATMQWTTWGIGDPEHMKTQMISEQTNISLLAALLMTVSAAFLLVR